MRKFFACLIVFGLSAVAGADSLHDIRLFPSDLYTRLVIDAEKLPGYRLSRLSDPERLVLDVYIEHGDALLDKINQAAVSTTYLRGVRAARYDQEKLRFVFDLDAKINFNLFALEPLGEYGHRVVLDVSPEATAQANPGLLSDLGFAGQTANPLPEPPPQNLDNFVVVIDAGHGGEDPGALNKFGENEKHIVLDIAKQLAEILNTQANIAAHLTRDKDIFLPLASRVRLAHKHNADLFISIHADSFTSSRPRGSSVFVLSRKGASSNLAQRLAEQENLADMVGGINTAGGRSKALDDSLTSIFKDGKERASRQFAIIAKESLAEVNLKHGDHIHSAGFAVLKSPSIPSVLVEVGFLSNPADAQLLSQADFRRRVAEQLAASIINYRNNLVTASQT